VSGDGYQIDLGAVLVLHKGAKVSLAAQWRPAVVERTHHRSQTFQKSGKVRKGRLPHIVGNAEAEVEVRQRIRPPLGDRAPDLEPTPSRILLDRIQQVAKDSALR
jgi:hypothetical protein